MIQQQQQQQPKKPRRPAALITRVCRACGDPFEVRRRDAVTCGVACRSVLHRARGSARDALAALSMSEATGKAQGTATHQEAPMVHPDADRPLTGTVEAPVVALPVKPQAQRAPTGEPLVVTFAGDSVTGRRWRFHEGRLEVEAIGGWKAVDATPAQLGLGDATPVLVTRRPGVVVVDRYGYRHERHSAEPRERAAA